MEANINNFLFKLDRSNNTIEVYQGTEVDRPFAFIRVDTNITEKDFHYEISDWFLNNS